MVNVITCNKALFLFPLQTSIYRHIFLLRISQNHFEQALIKYEKYGWGAARVLESQFNISKQRYMTGSRTVGDSLTRTITLEPAVMESHLEPKYVLECSEFEMKLTNEDAVLPEREAGPRL